MSRFVLPYIGHFTTFSPYSVMLNSAYVIFTSNQATMLINLPYPPFGMATISFVGLSSYLLLVGIYASAVSVAEDTKLRN